MGERALPRLYFSAQNTHKKKYMSIGLCYVSCLINTRSGDLSQIVSFSDSFFLPGGSIYKLYFPEMSQLRRHDDEDEPEVINR